MQKKIEMWFCFHVTCVTGVTGKKIAKKNGDVIFFSCHQCHRCHRQVLTYETSFNICDFFHVTGVTGVTGKKIAKKSRCDFFFMSPVSPVLPAKRLQKKIEMWFFFMSPVSPLSPEKKLQKKLRFDFFFHVTSVTSVTGKKIARKKLR